LLGLGRLHGGLRGLRHCFPFSFVLRDGRGRSRLLRVARGGRGRSGLGGFSRNVGGGGFCGLLPFKSHLDSSLPGVRLGPLPNHLAGSSGFLLGMFGHIDEKDGDD
jgi:hypothetical protein